MVRNAAVEHRCDIDSARFCGCGWISKGGVPVALEHIARKGPYAVAYREMGRFIARFMEKSTPTPERIAKKIVRVMRAPFPRLRQPVTTDAYMFYYLRRLLPRRLYHELLYKHLPSVKQWGGQGINFFEQTGFSRSGSQLAGSTSVGRKTVWCNQRFAVRRKCR